jgi:hypothetical protein
MKYKIEGISDFRKNACNRLDEYEKKREELAKTIFNSLPENEKPRPIKDCVEVSDDGQN